MIGGRISYYLFNLYYPIHHLIQKQNLLQIMSLVLSDQKKILHAFISILCC